MTGGAALRARLGIAPDAPLLVLWGSRGALPLLYDDVMAIWRDWAGDVTGAAVDATHFLVEDQPAEVTDRLIAFFA